MDSKAWPGWKSVLLQHHDGDYSCVMISNKNLWNDHLLSRNIRLEKLVRANFSNSKKKHEMNENSEMYTQHILFEDTLYSNELKWMSWDFSFRHISMKIGRWEGPKSIIQTQNYFCASSLVISLCMICFFVGAHME